MPAARSGFAKLITVAVLALAIPALLLRLGQPEAGEAFPVGDRLDPKVELGRLNKAKSDWVIVGNSMVNPGVTMNCLSSLWSSAYLRPAARSAHPS